MIVEEVLKQNLKGEKWLFSPNIPNKKLNGACSMHQGLEPNKIIALFDITLLGSGKSGFILTGAKLYYRAFVDSSVKFDVEYSNIAGIKIVKPKKEKCIEIVTKDDNVLTTYSEDLYDFDYDNFVSVIEKLISEENSIEFREEDQSIPLDCEKDIVKINFIKILSNLSINESGILDDKSYAQIIQLIARLDFNAESRFNMRSYMLNESDRIDNTILLKEIEDNMAKNRLHEVHISLMKEAINVFRAQKEIKPYVKGAYKKEKKFTDLQSLLNVSDDEISLIEDSIINDERIFMDRDVSDDKIKELFTDMAGKAAAVGVPLAAVYLTGTVGFSAAGLTSGLAALGMGGVLGFSSMVTGIGVALVIGVVSYKLVGRGIRAITGDESEKYKQRETLLQNVVKKSQRTLNLLIEDINYTTLKVVSLVKNNEVDKMEMEELQKQIQVLASSQAIIMGQSQYSEKEKTIIHLPKHLDVNRLESLTRDATLKDIREIILEFYEEEVIETEEGQKTVMVLHDEKFSLEELEELLKCFDDIGYNDFKEIASKAITQGVENVGKNIVKGFGSFMDKFGK